MLTDSKDNIDCLLQAAGQAGITRPRELANFMGQMQVESQGFSRTEEASTTYTRRP